MDKFYFGLVLAINVFGSKPFQKFQSAEYKYNKVNTLRGSPQSLSLCKYVKNSKPAMQHKIDWLQNTVCAKIMKMHSKIEHLLRGKR